MTEFMKREQEALDAFQEEMNKYGLKVARSVSGRYRRDGDFEVRMHTEQHLLKGNKPLINRLCDDGYTFGIYNETDPKTGRRYGVFVVSKMATIRC